MGATTSSSCSGAPCCSETGAGDCTCAIVRNEIPSKAATKPACRAIRSVIFYLLYIHHYRCAASLPGYECSLRYSFSQLGRRVAGWDPAHRLSIGAAGGSPAASSRTLQRKVLDKLRRSALSYCHEI